MEGDSGVTRCIIDELHSSGIEGYQMEGESGLTRSIIDGPHSLDIQGYQMESEKCVTDGSLMKFILWISKEIKWKRKVVLLRVSLTKFILRISKELK